MKIKREIISNFIPKKLSSSDFFYGHFFNNLELIRQFRNASAHGAMFSAQRFTSQSLTKTFKNESNCFELYSNKEFKNLGYGKGDFYSLLILLILLSNSRDIANSILTDVKMTIDANLKSLTNTSKVDQKGKEAFFDLSNLPIDYFIRLTKFIQKIY